jgi:hypothetical protein
VDLRAQILQFCATPLPSEAVTIPEWDDLTVAVGTMTAGQRDRFEVGHARAKNADFRARLAVFTVQGPDGRPLFTEADIPALSAGPARPLDRIVEAALRLNRFTAADVKELEKNSPSGPAAAS